ncbi:uncharacterized protein LOC143923394 isoform X3 [Lithobates pipiens]
MNWRDVTFGHIREGVKSGVMSARERDVVGIFSRSSSDDYSWLVELLKSNYFRETVQEVRPCYIFNNGFQQFVNDLSQCTIGILYHTKNRGRINITDVHDSLYDEELENLNKILGIDNVLVVIDDVEDSSDQEKSRILENQPSIGEWASDLLLISQTDKADKSKLERKLKSIKRFCNPSGNQSLQVERSKVKNTICVFSISEEGRIEWLRRLLSSDIFGNQHVTFHSFSLDDNEGLRAVEFQCKVAVLYHTMQSGEFPTTPRGEFLYHKVLPQMSEKLGKGNVVMIIDDVQGKGMMSLKKKRSDIEKLTEDLCPISHKDKEDEMKLVQKLKTLQPFLHMSGKGNVVMIIDDVQGKEMMSLKKKRSDIEKLTQGLCPISHKDKEDEMKLVQKLKTLQPFLHMSEHPHKVDLAPQTEKTLNTCSQKTPTSRRSIIGIFSVSEEGCIVWLRRLLSLDIFGQREVTYHKIPSHDNVGLEDGKLQCVVAILYHTMKTGNIVTPQGEFLYHKVTDQLVQKLGKDNVIVLIDDLQNYTDKKWAMWVQSKIERWAGDLLYFLQEEKHNRHLLVQRLKSLNLFRQPPEYHPKSDPIQPTSGTLNTCSQKTPTSRRSIIGIFSVSGEDHINWLRRLLSLDIFGQREVTYHKIPSHDNVGLEDGKLQCVVAILYHTMKTGNIVTSQREFLYHKVTDQLEQKLGKDNVIVLIDDLQNYTDKKWVMWVQSKIERWAGDLLYFLQEEKHNQQLLVQKLKSLKLFRQPTEYHPKSDPIQPTSRTLNTISAPASSVIGIFSCSEKYKCSWLERLLSSEEFGNHQVVFHQISPGNMKGVQSMVSLCKFGILYHCMDRGYKPLTDHETSLYDEELLYLSSTLGKSRVIVVIDELGNSDKEVKSWTLENQPSLGMLARDVLLFTKLEKSHQEKSNRRMSADRNLGTVNEKLNTLKENLKEGMTSESFSS